MTSKTTVITLMLTIEDPKIDVDKSVAYIKEEIEKATRGPLADACWNIGDFQAAEVISIQIINTHEFL